MVRALGHAARPCDHTRHPRSPPHPRAPGPTEPMSSTHAERLRQALASLPMFKDLPGPLRQRVEGMATLLDADKGDELWHAGDAAEHLTVIVSGRVKVVRHADTGDVILEIFSKGETVGAVAVYNRV